MSQSVTVRLEDELLTRIDALDGSRSATIAALLERGLDVPEGTPRLMLSPSQLACLDQLAERNGVDRIELLKRYVSERLRREFTDDRHRLLQDASNGSSRR